VRNQAPGARKSGRFGLAWPSQSKAIMQELHRVPEMPKQTGPASETRLTRGDKVGRYVIRGLVGRGAMGEVYRAHDPELGRKVAIKLLRANVADTGGALEQRSRLLQEGRAMARIRHRNVIAVHDVGTFDDGVFIAMEFVEGNTIAYWLLAAPRTWQEVLAAFVQAGRGLAAAHDQHVVHHDFKPDNVMIGRDGDVRVMDFGLARELRRRWMGESIDASTSSVGVSNGSLYETVRLGGQPAPAETPGVVGALPTIVAGSMIGTPAYMSPEQFLGAPTDERTDQFSFCVALYEALYGQRPFAGATLLELRGNVFAGQVTSEPSGSRVPRAVRRALVRGMAPNPAARFHSMHTLLAELERASTQTWAPRDLLWVSGMSAVVAAGALAMRLLFGMP
jgi:serine/threonine protein kinase